MAGIKIKRAYEEPERSDGYRILIDGLWPRGIKKDDLDYDEWAKELAPSKDLRTFFSHDLEKWKEFSARFTQELRGHEARDKLLALAKKAKKSNVTLLYSSKDEDHNNAVIVKKQIEKLLQKLEE